MPSSNRQSALLLVLSGTMLTDALEVSTMVVSMPAVAVEFGLTPAAASAFVVLFASGFGGSIMAGNRLVERIGRRPVYLWAMLGFAIASVAGGLAPDAGTLAVTRAVKGACVALTAPTGLAIIASTFPAGATRTRALAVYSLFGGSGFSAGLLLSGALTGASWRWALAFSGPVALVLLAAAHRVVPAGREPAAVPGPDPGGGCGQPGGVVTAPVLRSAAGGAILNGSFWGFLFIATFELQRGQGWSPLATGFGLLPASLPLALVTPYSGRLIGRIGPVRLIATGNLAAVAGYGWYAARSPHRSYVVDVLPTVVLVGVAFTLCFSALHVQATASSPPGRQRTVSGLYQTSVQIGGAAVLSLVAAATQPEHRSAAAVVAAVATVGVLVAIAGLAPAGAPRGESRVH